MKSFIGPGSRLACGLATAALCLGVACSDTSGTPDGDVMQDVGVEDMQEDDTIISTDTDDPDTSGYQDIIVDVTDPVALELVAMGKEYLSAGESLSAMDAFQRALQREPDLQDAMWGMVLGRFQSMVSMWGSLLGLVNFRDDPDEVVTPIAMPVDFPFHPGTIGANVDSMYAAAADQKARLDALKAAGENPVFTLEGGLPLYIKDDLMMNLCCDWDLSDVYGISSFNNLMLAFVSFLGSQDTDISLQYVEDTMDVVPGIENALAAMLDEFPEFLTLMPEVGDDIWLSMKVFLAASIDDALESARLMGEGNDLANNVATLSDDEKPYLVLHGTFPGDATEMQFLWEGKTASMKAILEKAKASLAGTPDIRLSLDADVLVAIGVLVDIINRTIGIQTIVEGLGIELPEIVTGLMSSLDPNDPEQLVGLLGSLTSLLGIQNGAVEVDLAGFLDSPFNVRDMLPWYGNEPGTQYKAFTRSFECIRGGTVINGGGLGETLHPVFIHDSDIVVADAYVTMTSFSTPDMTGEAFDVEDLVIPLLDDFEGIYKGDVVLFDSVDPSPADDGRLAVPAGGSVQGAYTSLAANADLVVIEGDMTDGLTPWKYGAACPEGSFAWDSTRFGEEEFNGAYEVPYPGQQTSLEVIDTDGKESLSGLMAFKSPSFDGLLWIKTGETFAPADQATLAGFIGGVMTALEAF